MNAKRERGAILTDENKNRGKKEDVSWREMLDKRKFISSRERRSFEKERKEEQASTKETQRLRFPWESNVLANEDSVLKFFSTGGERSLNLRAIVY